MAVLNSFFAIALSISFVTSEMAISKSALDENLPLLLSSTSPSLCNASFNRSFALSRVTCAVAAPAKSRRAAALATPTSAKRTASLSSLMVGRSFRLRIRDSNLSCSGAQSVNAFLATASSSNDCISEILDSKTDRVSGRFDSIASLRGALTSTKSRV